jgi:hypothetical protein
MRETLVPSPALQKKKPKSQKLKGTCKEPTHEVGELCYDPHLPLGHLSFHRPHKKSPGYYSLAAVKQKLKKKTHFLGQVIVVRKNNTQRHFTHCSKISAIVPAVLHK